MIAQNVTVMQFIKYDDVEAHATVCIRMYWTDTDQHSHSKMNKSIRCVHHKSLGQLQKRCCTYVTDEDLHGRNVLLFVVAM